MNSDKALKELEARLKTHKVTGKEALELLAKMVPLLRKRTNKLVEFTNFINGISEEDRLYVSAYGIWRRKDNAKGVPFWARANGPDFKLPPGSPESTVSPPLPPIKKVTIRVKGAFDGRH